MFLDIERQLPIFLKFVEEYFMKYMAGIFLMALALWQLIIAFRIRRIAKSGVSKEFANNEIERLNKISRVVQVLALTSFLALLYWGIK